MSLPSKHLTSGGTIGGIQVLQIVEALEVLGVAARRMRDIVGFPLEGLDDPWVRLPRDVVLRLFVLGERVTGDRLIGLHAGQRARFRGPLAHLFASAPRLRPALELYALFSRLAVDTSRVRIDVRGESASLVIAVGSGTPAANRHVVDHMLMATVRTCWRHLRPGFGFREIHVRHTDRYYGSEAATAFGCPVRFEKPDDRIVFPARDLDAPLRGANPLVAAQIEKALSAMPSVVEPHPTFEERVEHAVRALLIAGRRPDQTAVAKRLHVSVRSLQRRLEDEATGFREVRDHVLRALVEAQLWNPDLSIKEIAIGLGFADGAAFSKAFRRWTGEPPTAFRQRVASRAGRRSSRRRVR